MKDTYVFINKFAGRGPRYGVRIKTECIKLGFERKNIVEPKAKNAIQPSLQKLIKTKPKKLLIAGGDGTITSAISHCLKHSPDTVIGVLPLGTANVFSKRITKTKTNPIKALHQLSQLEKLPIYVVSANEHYFSLACDLGTTVEAFERTSNRQKRLLGKYAYVLNFFPISHKAKPFDVDIRTADGQGFIGKTFQVIVSNQSFNKRVRFMSDIHASNPQFDISIYTANKFPLEVYVNMLLYAVSFGRITRNMQIIRTNNARIVTTSPQKYGIDGDTKGSTPLDLAVEPTPITVLAR